jgi:L-lactate permease
MWNQVYNPFDNAALSTIAAALPVVTLLLLIASNKVKAHIAAVIALATLGLAFAGTGVLYPFFGTLLGWLGVALTGTDTASNILS